jgi:hypothetical protein
VQSATTVVVRRVVRLIVLQELSKRDSSKSFSDLENKRARIDEFWRLHLCGMIVMHMHRVAHICILLYTQQSFEILFERTEPDHS